MGLFDFIFGKNGEYFIQYPDNDWIRDQYKYGKRHGVCEFGHNFVTKGKVTYENDMKNGRAVFPRPDGKPYKEIYYKDDEMHGPYRVWNDSDMLVTDGNHSNGTRDGRWREFNEEGAVVMDVRYNKGEMINLDYYNSKANEKK